MKGYVVDIESKSIINNYFREVLYTSKNIQLVVMSLLPGEEIGEEVHTLDQFIRIDKGEGKAILDGIEHPIKDGYAVVVPQGTRHNIVNTSSSEALKLYTIYSPPDHKDHLIHKTKAEAMASDEPFDGVTSE